MCGICGFVSKSFFSDDLLVKMGDSMSYRGPNDSGVWTADEGGYQIGFAHRRLSILDLTPSGHQPMVSEDGDCVIVFNGEIYNYAQLQDELASRGRIFCSKSDTEVLLQAYSEWGDQCLTRLDGMFAFALYDKKKHRILFARDRMGEKPFYYYWDGATLIFGSELKPLMLHPQFQKELSFPAISEFLCNKYVAAPNTIFRNTYKLAAASYAVWEKEILRIEKYWDILEKYRAGTEQPIKSFDEAKTQLGRLITDSVSRRLVADVPVGCFLSAGIDSTIVAATAVRMKDKPLSTFTIGFHEEERNEADRAKKIAHYLQTEHVELYVGDRDILELTDSIPWYYDEPFSDASQLPTMLVSKLASTGVTVALSGDGGDEFFCGYKMYDWVRLVQSLDSLAGMAHPVTSALGLERLLPNTARALLRNRDAGLKTQLFTDVREEIVQTLMKKGYCSVKSELERELTQEDWQVRRMLLDMQTYLPDEVLAKTDRASMKYSLEVRCPLLDHQIAEYSFRLPHNMKYFKREKKYILKQLAYDLVPKELLDMPKRGFGVPLGKWLRGPLKAKINQYSDETLLKRQGIFEHSGLQELVRKVRHSDSAIYSSVLWSFLVFQMWYQCYIEDLW